MFSVLIDIKNFQYSNCELVYVIAVSTHFRNTVHLMKGKVFNAPTNLRTSEYPQQMTCWNTFFFYKAMSFNRFQKVKQYLHFANNEAYDSATHPNSKLNKVWPIYNRFEDKCKSNTPEKDAIINESLMLYKVRLGWEQHIPLKRAYFGIKYLMLCNLKSGFVYDFIIYTRSGTVLMWLIMICSFL